MHMTVNVVLAVAVVTLAAGAVTELQLGVTDVCSAADGAFMGVELFHRGGGCLVGTGKGDRAGLFGGLLLKELPGIDAPGNGDDIQHILAEEQQVVADGDQREQVVGDKTCSGKQNYVVKGQGEIQQCEDPGLYRDDEKQ